MNLQPVIGLEIHIQLKTKSKMFCGCNNKGENEPPNTTVCAICMGHPGTLPVLNDQALKWGVLLGMALNCEIPTYSKFDRKNYFYPDLAKGYQISQFDLPVATGGNLEIDIPNTKAPRQIMNIRITRAHLEEDAAKSMHSDDGKATFVDYNRAGTPLVETVTEPDFRTAEEAKYFLQELQRIARYLGISDADMEKGHLRCDANISLRKIDDQGLPIDDVLHPKTEVKNINSFNAVERALNYEIKRQTELWQTNSPPSISSTRGWNEEKGITEAQRTKEESHDYRYFPEPDLPPLDLSDIREEMKSKLPELPRARRARFMDEYGLTYSDARILTDDPEWSYFTENVFSELRAWLATTGEIEGTDAEINEATKAKLAKLVGGWLTSKLMGLMSEQSIDIRILKITPENFAHFLTLIYENKINSTAAREILGIMLEAGEDPQQIVEERGLGQMGDENELEEIIENVIKNNPAEIEKLKAGEVKVLKFLIGVIMKETKGRANPKIAETILNKLLGIEKSE